MKKFIWAFVCLPLIYSCNNHSASSANDTFTGIANINSSKENTAINDSTASPQANGTMLQAGAPIEPDWDKKIIRTANIEAEVNNYKFYNLALHGKLKNFGAYISQEQETVNDYMLQNDITIKVPVLQFEELVNNICCDSVKITAKNISSEDVTGEVVDTKARLEAKKETRNKYLAFTAASQKHERNTGSAKRNKQHTGRN